ncbi:MAG: sigma-70 family RNA polymerase sigma factor, partial [Bacteroidota bacterium]
WKKRHRINIQTSLKAYLKRAAVNKSLNYIRDQKIKFEEVGKAPVLSTKSHNAQLEAKELQEQINLAVNALPERCRIIFSLSRFEEMSYQEIANTLQISTKTVENQISKALKILRQAIGPYLSKDTLLLLVFFYHFLS